MEKRMVIFGKCRNCQSEIQFIILSAKWIKANRNVDWLANCPICDEDDCVTVITEKLSDRSFCKAIKCPNQLYLDSQPLVKVEIEDTLRNCRKYCRHTAYEVNEWLKGSK